MEMCSFLGPPVYVVVFSTPLRRGTETWKLVRPECPKTFSYLKIFLSSIIYKKAPLELLTLQGREHTDPAVYLVAVQIVMCELGKRPTNNSESTSPRRISVTDRRPPVTTVPPSHDLITAVVQPRRHTITPVRTLATDTVQRRASLLPTTTATTYVLNSTSARRLSTNTYRYLAVYDEWPKRL